MKARRSTPEVERESGDKDAALPAAPSLLQRLSATSLADHQIAGRAFVRQGLVDTASLRVDVRRAMVARLGRVDTQLSRPRASSIRELGTAFQSALAARDPPRRRAVGGGSGERFWMAERRAGPPWSDALLRLERHIDECEACQQAFMDARGGPAAWCPAVRAAADREPLRFPALDRTRGRPLAFLHRFSCKRCRDASRSAGEPMDWECPAAVAVEFAEASFPFYLQRPRAKYRPAIHGNHRPIRRPTKPTVDGTGLVEPAPVARIYRSLATAPNGAEAQAVRAAVEEMIAEGKAVWADGPGARRAVDARGRVDTSGLAAGSIGLPLRVDVKYRPGVIISAHSGEERTVSLEERGALSEEGVHVETIGVVAGFEPKSKPRSVIGAQIDLNPSQMRLPYAMATPADMRADEEESAERPVWRASTDYKSAFERLPMDDYAARYFHLSVPQPDGTVRLARLTSPGFGVSTTPFTAECVFSVLDEWVQRVHGPFSHRFVDDVHVWAETEREAAARLDTVCVAGSMVGLPVSEAKTTRPTRDGIEYLGVRWALEGISLPGPKRRRAVGWLETLRALPPSVDAARWWQTGLGILGHAASVRRDLWPMAMWLMQRKMAADREEDIPTVAQWAARHALAKGLGETMDSRRAVPYLLVGSDASENGWGAVVQRGAAGDDWPEGEVYGALGSSAEGLSSMVLGAARAVDGCARALCGRR